MRHVVPETDVAGDPGSHMDELDDGDAGVADAANVAQVGDLAKDFDGCLDPVTRRLNSIWRRVKMDTLSEMTL